MLIVHNKWIFVNIANHVSVRGVAHHASERDDWSDAGEVEKDDGGKTLHVKSVLEIAQVLRISPLHVVNETAKQPGENSTHCKFGELLNVLQKITLDHYG